MVQKNIKAAQDVGLMH